MLSCSRKERRGKETSVEMNENSVICRLIRDDPDGWRETMRKLNVRVKEDGVLAMFNYGVAADFTNPIVREARGIIIRLDSLDPVCWAFDKFCNPQEPGAALDLDGFDWNRCRCQEKVDGSIVKLFFNPISGEWQWATNACMNAKDAEVASGLERTFLDVILKADDYGKIPFESLDRNVTYVFELVSPETQVIVKYPTAHLYHTGARNLISGKELNVDLGIEKPREFPLRSLDDCVKAAAELNAGADGVRQEGFVVVDPNWKRVKVKSPEYFEMHRLSANATFSKEKIVDVLRRGETTVDALAEDFPLYAVYFKYYAYRMAELEFDVTRFVGMARNLYEEYSFDRKAVALAIRNRRLAQFGFAALGNEKTAKELLDGLSIGKYCKLIPDYERNEL